MRKLLCLLLVLIMLLSVGCSAAVSVVGANINEDGHLVLSMSDGSTIDAGYAKGEDGIDGKDGLDGKDGRDGIDGVDGVGIKKAAVNDSGHLMIRLTDDTLIDTGYVIGADGKDGRDGVDGKDGNDGKDGEDGADGIDGVDGKTPYIGDNGNWWIGDEDTGVKAGSNDFIYNDDGNGTVLIAYVGSDYHVTLPEKTTEVGENAFKNNLIIASVTFNDAVIKINDRAFNGCMNLKEIHLSESLQEIEDYVFTDCNKLTSLELPASLQKMTTGTFIYGPRLESLTCKAITPPIALEDFFSPQFIYEDVLFDDVSPMPDVIYVPAVSVDAYKTSKTWYNVADRIQAIP